MPARKRLVIIGAGGMAGEVAWMLRIADPHGTQWELVGYAVSDPRYLTPPMAGLPVGTFEDLGSWGADVAIVAIGEALLRRRLAVEASEYAPGLEWPSLVDRRAVVADVVSIGEGVVVAPGSVVSVDVQMEAFSFVNYGATIGHGARIGAGSIVAPGANVAGDVRIGCETLIGSGAQVLRNVRIGDRAVVGAGSVVNRDVGDDSVVVGVPARPLLKDSAPTADA